MLNASNQTSERNKTERRKIMLANKLIMNVTFLHPRERKKIET